MAKADGKLHVQVRVGWHTWRDLGSSMHDYDLTYECQGQKQIFEVPNSAIAQKKSDIKLSFSAAAGDNWKRYLRTYAAGSR